jgi:hypothetical protein
MFRIVKQEVAKEGVLPFSLWFAENYDLSLRTLFRFRRPEKSPEIHLHDEKTPAATMVLHWVTMNMFLIPTVFIIQPVPYSPAPAYTFLVTFYTYVLDVFWFGITGLGVLYLRLWPNTKWRKMSSFNPWLSTIAALIFTLLNLFPVISVWIPDPAVKYLARTNKLVIWYAGPTVGLVVLGLSVLYWFGFWSYIRRRESRERKKFEVERIPIIREEEGSYIQLFEIVGCRWSVR